MRNTCTDEPTQREKKNEHLHSDVDLEHANGNDGRPRDRGNKAHTQPKAIGYPRIAERRQRRAERSEVPENLDNHRWFPSLSASTQQRRRLERIASDLVRQPDGDLPKADPNQATIRWPSEMPFALKPIEGLCRTPTGGVVSECTACFGAERIVLSNTARRCASSVSWFETTRDRSSNTDRRRASASCFEATRRTQ